MRYQLALRHDSTGEPLTLHGFKLIENNPGFDCWTDTTTLFTTVYRGADVAADDDDGQLLAIGVLHIDLLSFARQMIGFNGTSGSILDRFGAAAALPGLVRAPPAARLRRRAGDPIAAQLPG